MRIRWQKMCVGIIAAVLFTVLFDMPVSAETELVETEVSEFESSDTESEQIPEVPEILVEEISERNEWAEDAPGYEYQEENTIGLFSERIEYANTLSDAADMLRQEMICRNGIISIYYQGEYVSGMSKDILEVAVAYDDSLPSVAGDYLRYHYNRVVRRTYKGSNEDGEYYRFEYEIYYLSSYEQETAVETRVVEILDALDVYSADRETQIRSVYSYIAENVCYDNMIYDDFNVHSAYGAAIRGKAVCQGYSLLLYRLLQELGIKNRMIPGEAGSVRHVWNIVEMDGLWYNMDVTWDWGKSQNYDWFLKGTESFDDAHHRDSTYTTETFLAMYPMSDKDYGYVEEETTETESETEGEEKDSLTLFVERLYELILDRAPDKTGLEFWKEELETGELKVMDVIDGFFKSAEFIQREDSVSIIPDILNKMSKDAILIENAPEEIQWEVMAFVYRLYSYALERQPDRSGLDNWYQWLTEGKETAESAVYGFVFSQEMINRNLDNEIYVKTLYRVFMNREYDQSGLADWVSRLNDGLSRKEVFDGFLDSEEFKEMAL